MRSKLLLLLSVYLSISTVHGQQQVRKFPTSINYPTIDVFAPFLSLDGSSLVYSSYYGLEQEVLIYFSERARGDWTKPVELPKHLNTKLNLARSYTLSPDGSILYITSIKSNGVGRYDIWYTERKGNIWGDLKNMFMPINSKSNDGTPTFTPDGKTMYFMRCEQMSQQKVSDCKIFMSTMDNVGKWQEPIELPANINSGNSQTPRIMADGETLIFSSDKLQPNKGGMDLYYSKFVGGAWQDPLPLDFANTQYDNQFVSAMASGRYLTMEQKGEKKWEIVDVLMPEEIRPKGVMKVAGAVLDEAGKVTPAYISVTNEKGERVFSGRPDIKDGSFFLYLVEGGQYELSVDPEMGNHTYYSKTYDLRTGLVPTIDKVDIVLKELKADDEWELSNMYFKENSSELITEPSALRRLTRLLKAADFNYEVQVMLIGYEEDSIRSSPDLTESIVDSVVYHLEKIDTLLGDTTSYDSLVIHTTFHNNRTEKQAQQIIEKLVAEGVDRERLSYFINARAEAIPEKRKLLIRIAARKKK